MVMLRSFGAGGVLQGHSDKITAIAAHPELPIVATGQVGSVPEIHVWDSTGLTCIIILRGLHRRCIHSLDFSASGSWLLSVGADDLHSIVVYDWKHGQVVARSTGFDRKPLGTMFTYDGRSIAQCGVQFIRFWEIVGQNMVVREAILNPRAKLQSFTCLGLLGNHVVVGAEDGHLYRFVGRNLDSILKAHTSCINAMAHCQHGVVTGCVDGIVKVWSGALEMRATVNISTLGARNLAVRALDWDEEYGRIVIGTAGGDLIEVMAGDGEPCYRHPIMECHGGNELWGLAVHPMLPRVATVGDDAVLRIWDLYEFQCVQTFDLDMSARACAFSPDAQFICIGYGSTIKQSQRQFDGKWAIHDALVRMP